MIVISFLIFFILQGCQRGSTPIVEPLEAPERVFLHLKGAKQLEWVITISEDDTIHLLQRKDGSLKPATDPFEIEAINRISTRMSRLVASQTYPAESLRTHTVVKLNQDGLICTSESVTVREPGKKARTLKWGPEILNAHIKPGPLLIELRASICEAGDRVLLDYVEIASGSRVLIVITTDFELKRIVKDAYLDLPEPMVKMFEDAMVEGLIVSEPMNAHTVILKLVGVNQFLVKNVDGAKTFSADEFLKLPKSIGLRIYNREKPPKD